MTAQNYFPDFVWRHLHKHTQYIHLCGSCSFMFILILGRFCKIGISICKYITVCIIYRHSQEDKLCDRHLWLSSCARLQQSQQSPLSSLDKLMSRAWSDPNKGVKLKSCIKALQIKTDKPYFLKAWQCDIQIYWQVPDHSRVFKAPFSLTVLGCKWTSSLRWLKSFLLLLCYRTIKSLSLGNTSEIIESSH